MLLEPETSIVDDCTALEDTPAAIGRALLPAPEGGDELEIRDGSATTTTHSSSSSSSSSSSVVLWAQSPCGAYVDVRRATNEGHVLRGFCGRLNVASSPDEGGLQTQFAVAAANRVTQCIPDDIRTNWTLTWDRHVDSNPERCPSGVDRSECIFLNGDTLMERGPGFMEIWRRIAPWLSTPEGTADIGGEADERRATLALVTSPEASPRSQPLDTVAISIAGVRLAVARRNCRPFGNRDDHALVDIEIEAGGATVRECRRDSVAS